MIIRRTLIYGALTATLALIFVASVVVLEQIVRFLTGASSQPAVVASTLLIVALFQPLRLRIQAIIDRRFYRRRYNSQQTLAAFSARLRDEMDLEALTDDMLAVVQETLQPQHVTLWLKQ